MDKQKASRYEDIKNNRPKIVDYQEKIERMNSDQSEEKNKPEENKIKQEFWVSVFRIQRDLP